MKKKILWGFALIIVVVIAAGGYCWWASKTSNPWNAKMVGDIPVPFGYKRAEVAEGSYAEFLRSQPMVVHRQG